MTTPELPRLVGGHVALDLVNSVAPRVPGAEPEEEYLPTPAALLHWAVRTELLTDGEARLTEEAWAASDGGEQALRAAVELREATYTALLAALSPGAGSASPALDQLFLRWNVALGRAALVPGDGGPHAPAARLLVGQVPAWSVPDRLAEACVDLLRTVDPAQLKACPLPDGGCGWLFLDRSRNGSRRWCTMEDCGAHAKARRLTERRRARRT
jgi:predicted RNA-binding Zn ribbon-like protein